MSRLFFGKFSARFPEQIEHRFYAAGPPDNSWYGGIRIGDYVFPIHQGSVIGLWQVTAFKNDPLNAHINPEGAAYFKEIKPFEKGIPLSRRFLLQRDFVLDLNMVNKSAKHAKGTGFFEIATVPPNLNPEEIEFPEEKKRSIYLATSEDSLPENIQDRDLLVLLESPTLAISSIKLRKGGQWVAEEMGLWKLYQERNPTDKRLTLKQLLEYARLDGASNKEKYLEAVIEKVSRGKPFQVHNPVRLYDNILVGRKVFFYGGNKPHEGEQTSVPQEPLFEAPDNLDGFAEYSDLLHDCPNLILYGPPGTGKTWSAQKVVEYHYHRWLKDHQREQDYLPFSEIQKQGLVEVITFHQAFSYEEFVEGIRPVLNNKDEENTRSGLRYEISDGVLKKLADRASISREVERVGIEGAEKIRNNAAVYKVSLGERSKYESIYEDAIESSEIAIGYLGGHDLSTLGYYEIYDLLEKEQEEDAPRPIHNSISLDSIVNTMQVGDLVVIPYGLREISDIGVIIGDYEYNPKKDFPHRRKVKWLHHFDPPVDIRPLNDGIQMVMKAAYHLYRVQPADLLKLIETHQPKGDSEVTEHPPGTPHFLIIDEINRGNVSRILGEMMTLLEKDKRENLSVTLPYSKKEFSLPPNLFLIGTMNTADRSIAVMDSALRRRFVFREIEPDPEAIESELIGGPCDPQKILRVLNQKLQEAGGNRDQRFGHADLMGIDSESQLRRVWFSRILPQVMDFFYNDGEAVARVIGEDFLLDKKNCSPHWKMTESEFTDAIKKFTADR